MSVKMRQIISNINIYLGRVVKSAVKEAKWTKITLWLDLALTTSEQVFSVRYMVRLTRLMSERWEFYDKRHSDYRNVDKRELL